MKNKILHNINLTPTIKKPIKDSQEKSDINSVEPNNYKNLTYGTLGSRIAEVNYDYCIRNKEISKKLKEIEKKENIKIIYACEVGSKAWGSANNSSDFDLRFIYVSNKEAYLDERKKDTISCELNDKYDIYGYDLRKIMKMLEQGNYTPYEWINSPVKYEQSEFSERLSNIVNHSDVKKNFVKSYLNIANTNYEKTIKNCEKPRIKNYLLVLKHLLTAESILNSQNNISIKYQDLFKKQLKDNQNIYVIANDLLNKKCLNNNDDYTEPKPLLNEYIENKIKILSQSIDDKEIKTIDEKILNKFFQDTVDAVGLKQPIKITPQELSDMEKYPQDIEYRKKILASMNMPEANFSLLKSITGPQEFSDIIKSYNNTPEIYSVNAEVLNSGKVILKNVLDRTFQANLHIHTNYSDGEYSVKELLDAAAKYANSMKTHEKGDLDKKEQKTFVIAITDHNTVDGCKEAISIVKNNPEKYKNLKIVLGVELCVSEPTACGYTPKKPYQIHMLAQCINPYNEDLSAMLKERVNPNNKCYSSIGDIKTAIKLMEVDNTCLLGYAHPLENMSLKKIPPGSNVTDVVIDLIKKFKENAQDKFVFVENYYQSYKNEIGKNDLLKTAICDFCNNNSIISTGGIDSHHKTIFFN